MKDITPSPSPTENRGVCVIVSVSVNVSVRVSVSNTNTLSHREPWSLILYHDRFAELREEIKELMSQPNQPGEESLSEKVCQLVDEDLAIEEKTKLALFVEYNDSLAKQSIENR